MAQPGDMPSTLRRRMDKGKGQAPYREGASRGMDPFELAALPEPERASDTPKRDEWMKMLGESLKDTVAFTGALPGYAVDAALWATKYNPDYVPSVPGDPTGEFLGEHVRQPEPEPRAELIGTSIYKGGRDMIDEVTPDTSRNKANLAMFTPSERKAFEIGNVGADFLFGGMLGGGVLGGVRSMAKRKMKKQAGEALEGGIAQQLFKDSIKGAATFGGPGGAAAMAPGLIGTGLGGMMVDWDSRLTDDQNAINVGLGSAVGSGVGTFGWPMLKRGARSMVGGTGKMVDKMTMTSKIDEFTPEELEDLLDPQTLKDVGEGGDRLRAAVRAVEASGGADKAAVDEMLESAAVVAAHTNQSRRLEDLLKMLVDRHPELKDDLLRRNVQMETIIGDVNKGVAGGHEARAAAIEGQALKEGKDIKGSGKARRPGMVEERKAASGFHTEFRTRAKRERKRLDDAYEDLRKEAEAYPLESPPAAEGALPSPDDVPVAGGAMTESKAVTDLARTMDAPPEIAAPVLTMLGRVEELAIGQPTDAHRLVEKIMQRIAKGDDMTASDLMTVVQRLNQLKRRSANLDPVVRDRMDKAVDAAKSRFYGSANLPQELKDRFRGLQGEYGTYAKTYHGEQRDLLDQVSKTNESMQANMATRAFTGKESDKLDPARYGDLVAAAGEKPVNDLLYLNIMRRMQDKDGSLKPGAFARFMKRNEDFFADMSESPARMDLHNRLLDQVEGSAWKSLFKVAADDPEGFARKVSNMNPRELKSAFDGMKWDAEAAGLAKDYFRARLFGSLSRMEPQARLSMMRKMDGKNAKMMVDMGIVPKGDWEDLTALAEVHAGLVGKSIDYGQRVKAGDITDIPRKWMEQLESKTGQKAISLASQIRQMFFKFVSPHTWIIGSYMPRAVDAHAKMRAYNKLMGTAFTNRKVLRRIIEATKRMGEGDEKASVLAMMGAFNAFRGTDPTNYDPAASEFIDAEYERLSAVADALDQEGGQEAREKVPVAEGDN